MNRLLIFSAATLMGFFLASFSNKNLPPKLPMPQKRVETPKPRPPTEEELKAKKKEKQELERKKELESEEIPDFLLETGYFNNLPPKLTELQKQQILKEGRYTTIFSDKMGVFIANTPRNKRIVYAIENLPVSKITIVNGSINTVYPRESIPLGLYDFFNFNKGK